jgi:ABC-2 type transport system ATP-binding protein
VIKARDLEKNYGEVQALAEFDLDVPQGTVLALLGPNGAGKTTIVRILATLLEADSGSATVAGIDVAANPGLIREHIGLSGQYAAVDEYLTGFENLDMIGRLYRMSRQQSRTRARELLKRFDLEEAGDRPVKTYSGGMQRRLDLAGALVAEPAVLFLDEPTTGLDPRGRMEMWEVIRELVSGGATLLLTTQYMEEADRLADNIVVIDRGRSIAEGTADELKKQVGGERIDITVENEADLAAASDILTELAVCEVAVDEKTRSLTTRVTDGPASLIEALRLLDDGKVSLIDAGLRRPTLDDVFLALTGRTTEDGEPSEAVSDNADSGDADAC